MTEITSFSGDHAALSNFHDHHFYIPGTDEWWPTAEHAYQAGKADSRDGYLRVVHAATPGEAKKIGRRIKIRSDWEQIKREVMMRILLAKFADPQMRDQLLATGDAVLIEGNTWGDTFWGCVAAETRPRMIMPLWGEHKQWAGDNWLGRELMMVREVLR